MGMYKDGRDRHMTNRMPSDLVELLDLMAKEMGVTRTDALVAVLRWFFRSSRLWPGLLRTEAFQRATKRSDPPQPPSE